MGKAFKCDRCGKFFEGEAPRRIESSTTAVLLAMYQTKIYTICHDCAEQFDKFMKGCVLFEEIPGPKLNKGGY